MEPDLDDVQKAARALESGHLWTWLGHRDWCPLQWKEWPCDCPCTKPGCPGVDHCLGTDCPVVAHLETTG